jgi:hypothetical protein
MRSSVRVFVACWSALLAGLVLAIAPAAVGAGRAAAAAVVSVPCSTAALSAAITAANGSGPTTLVLAADCDYVISVPATADTGLPPITGNVSLLGGHGPNVDVGPGTTTISRDPAAPNFRILEVLIGGRLWVSSLTIANGNPVGFFGPLGGGIRNGGTLFVVGSTFTGNVASSGGGLANLFGATATVVRTGFSGNTAAVTGGAILNSGFLTVWNSSLSSNTATIDGGGLTTQFPGVSTLVQSTVDHNSSARGGGIFNFGGSTSLVQSTVEFNTATITGGGIATTNPDVFLTQSTVAFNTPNNCFPLNTIPGCVN